MSNVIALKVKRRPSIRPVTSEAFEKAWAAFPDTGRQRSSRILAWPEWQAVARETGEQDLLGAVVRYAANDKEHRRDCGAPGFHRWLKTGRWEHWLDATIALPATLAFADPELRASFFERFTNAAARRWLDRAEWDSASREIVTAWRPRPEWMTGPFNRWAKENRVNALIFKGSS